MALDIYLKHQSTPAASTLPMRHVVAFRAFAVSGKASNVSQ